MSRITLQNVENRIKRLADLVGMKTIARIQKQGTKYVFSNKFLKLDRCNSKCRLVIVDRDQNESALTRFKSKAELYEYLGGMAKGIELYKSKRP